MKKLFYLLLLLFASQFLSGKQFHSLDSDLIAGWHFNEGTGVTAYDEIGGYHGTIANGAWVTGKYWKCINFDGSSTVITFGDVAFTGGTGSFSCWFKVDEITTQKRIICDFNGPNQDLLIRINPDDIEFFWYEDGGAQAGGSFAVIEADRWYHIVCIANGTILKMYINGVLDDTTYTYNGTGQNTNNEIYMGRDDGVGNWFDGLIDDPLFNDRDLSREAKAMYLERRGKYIN